MTPTSRVNSRKMIERFEEQYREALRKSQRLLPISIAGLVISIMVVVVTMIFSSRSVPQIAYVLLGSLGFLVLLFWGGFHSSKKALEQEDLHGYAKENLAKVKTWKNRLVVWSIYTVLTVTFSFVVWNTFGWPGIIGLVACMALSPVVTAFMRSRHRKKDKEMWDWWEANKEEGVAQEEKGKSQNA